MRRHSNVVQHVVHVRPNLSRTAEGPNVAEVDPGQEVTHTLHTETGKLVLMNEVTRILGALEQGDPHAAEHLLPLVYDELRKLAAEKMAHEKVGHTLQATALVHEAYVRLVDLNKAPHWHSR